MSRLARLDITSDEVTRMTAQLAGMLEHFADIDALDLSAVEPMTQPYPLTNVFREDVVMPSLTVEQALSGAPDRAGDKFRVPAILDEE